MKTRDFLKDSSGSIAVSTVILMVVFVGLMAIVIDLGHVFTVQRTRMRDAWPSGGPGCCRIVFPSPV
jgi:Flp pilus assembly protein TadG